MFINVGNEVWEGATLLRDGLADLTDVLPFFLTAAEILEFPVVIREGLILALCIAPYIQYYPKLFKKK